MYFALKSWYEGYLQVLVYWLYSDNCSLVCHPTWYISQSTTMITANDKVNAPKDISLIKKDGW